MPAVSGRTHTDESHPAYRHEALLYSSRDEFMDVTLRFIRESIAADEPILVMLAPEKLEALGAELRGEGNRVSFGNMERLGVNPARLIPAWQAFLDAHAQPGRRVRGVGEPVWPGRSEAEVAECGRHEALLNVAFDDPPLWLLCPYDTATLDERAITDARRNHPFLCEHGSPELSATFPGADALVGFDEALPDPPADAVSMSLEARNLGHARVLVASFAVHYGMSEKRSGELGLAVHEIAANSVAHSSRCGTLRVWHDSTAVVCDVRSLGRIEDPLAGRIRPGLDGESGRGLWIANQLCELVQVRSFGDETAVRLHMRFG